MSSPRVRRVLIVEDHASLRQALARVCASLADTVDVAANVVEALEQLRKPPAPELMLVDFNLPDGTALDVLRQARHVTPAPRVIAMSGTAGPEATFEMAAQHGVCAYLPKPLDMASLHERIVDIWSTPPDLSPHLRHAVGRVGIHAVEETVRSTMVREAMAMTNGSVRGAARLLSISRQLLQHILRRG